MKKTAKIILIVLLALVLAVGGILAFVVGRMNKDAVETVRVDDEPEDTAPAAEPAPAVDDTVGFTVEEAPATADEPVTAAEPEAEPTAAEPTGEPELTEEMLLNMTVAQDEIDNQDKGIKQKDRRHKDVINVLLVGADVRRLNANATANADTVMMASINKRTKTVTLVSFLRDSYIEIRGLKGSVGMNKLNSAYANGGMGWLINTLNYKKNYDLDIQNYFGVGFRNFEKLIDSVGGVDVELTADECAYINWRCADIGKHDPKDDRIKLLKEKGRAVLEEVDGMHHLNGLQTLWYARDRTTGDENAASGSDFTRTSRQQGVLELVYNKVRSGLNLKELYNLAIFAMENSYTNMKFATLCEIGIFLLNNDITIQTTTMPRDKSWEYGSEIVGSGSAPVDVVKFKIDPNRKALLNLLYGDLLKEPAEEAVAEPTPVPAG